jgi:cytochrome c553
MRHIDKLRVFRRMAALLLAGAMGSAVGISEAAAPEIDATTRAYAESVAITVCGTCHGTRGNNTNPKFPLLAGQNANYLAAQLKAFHSQTRGDPDAIGYMWGMASELDDGTISALAAYYAAQTPDVSVAASPATVARGRDIYEHGVPAQGVPACGTCHGADAHGMADFPRLAGQHSQYVLKQLSSFQSSMRNVAIMHGVAQNLQLPEMQAVAAYLQAQP